eukprot:scaffold49775_cov71-Attheya_sp.AAC.2
MAKLDSIFMFSFDFYFGVVIVVVVGKNHEDVVFDDDGLVYGCCWSPRHRFDCVLKKKTSPCLDDDHVVVVVVVYHVDPS